MGFETLALVAIAGGTALKMVGDIAEGGAQQAAYEARAKTDLYNAAIANQRAASERQAAAAQAQDVERAGSRKIGQALALQAGTGVTAEGSPLLVDSQLIRESALAVERTKFVGEKRARALETEAGLLETAADYESQAGGYARRMSYLKAGTSLLSGIGSFGLAGMKGGGGGGFNLPGTGSYPLA